MFAKPVWWPDGMPLKMYFKNQHESLYVKKKWEKAIINKLFNYSFIG